MEALFFTPHQVLYRYQPSQEQTQPLHQQFNSLMHKQNSNIVQEDPATMLIDQIQKLLSSHKKQVHQVNKVQVSEHSGNSTHQQDNKTE